MEAKIGTLQENYDQLEGHGTQEVAKIKHLVLSFFVFQFPIDNMFY